MHSTGASEADFELGRNALLDITAADTIGESAGSVDEGEGVVSVHFAATMPGYPGWHWTVSIAHISGERPNVLETELMPGEGAVLAPDWIPWVDRLADYRAAQEAAGLAAETSDSDDDDSDDDDSDDDDSDDDDMLHAGDLDGVDIDEDLDDDPADDLDDHIEDDDLAAPAMGVGDTGQADADAEETGPEPPEISTGDQRGEKKQQDEKGE